MAERGSIRFGDTDIDYLVTRSVRRKKTVEITLDHQDLHLYVQIGEGGTKFVDKLRDEFRVALNISR